MSEAARDGNYVPSLIAVSNVDGTTPVKLYADPVTHRLLVDLAGSGSGDVEGPASSTDNAIARFDGLTGKIIQNSTVLIADSTGAISGTQSVSIGVQGSATGTLNLLGTTSGTVTIKPADAAGTWTLTLPDNDGDSGQVLTTNGSGVTSWASAGGVPTTITVANEATDTTCFLGFFTAATGDLGPKTNANLAFNSNTGVLTLTAPVLGTPTSGTLTNCTGLPISTGVSGLGTGIATALAINTGTAGAPVLFNGALGTPSSGTLTNATGLPISTGVSGLGTGIAAALAVNTGSAGAPVLFNGALGTPTSGTVTNLTGTASININGTVGATTPNTGVFTTLVAGSTTSLLLGTAGSAVGNIGFRNATSGTITLAPVTGALGTVTLSLPAATDQLVGRATTDTLTNKIISHTVEPGTDDTFTGEQMTGLLAGDTIAQWDLVYLDTTSGRWEFADADAVGTAGPVLLGLATAAGTDGNALTVLLRGVVRNDGWTWTGAGYELYVSTTAGGMTETAPSGAADVVRVVGYSLSDDCIYFNPSSDWVVIA